MHSRTSSRGSDRNSSVSISRSDGLNAERAKAEAADARDGIQEALDSMNRRWDLEMEMSPREITQLPELPEDTILEEMEEMEEEEQREGGLNADEGYEFKGKGEYGNMHEEGDYEEQGVYQPQDLVPGRPLSGMSRHLFPLDIRESLFSLSTHHTSKSF